MLSHNSIQNSSQPRRYKSFSNLTRPKLKHAKSFNTSELAQREAVAAAELAFQRARERFTTTNELEETREAKGTPFSLGSGDSQLSRKQSIRFTGSNAVKTRELPNTRREACNDRELPVLSYQDPRLEYVESNVASEPSSYRRLRRAKSMIAPRNPSSDLSTDGMNTSRGHFKRDSMRSSDGHNSPIRPPDHHLRRSFSFLRGVTDRISIGSQHCATDSAAVQIARDKYLHQLKEQRLKEQPSLQSLKLKRRTSRGFRHTVRISSITSNGIAAKSPLLSTDEIKMKSVSRKARSVSHTLKRTLKKVFGRPVPDATKLPEQHLAATKTHYDNNWNHRCSHISSPDIQLLRRIESHESILPEAICYRENDTAQTERIRSLTLIDENSNLQSRVSSWSNSTAGNTINTPQHIERKRLSVIKEDGGPYQPSSSTARYMDQENGYSVFQHPVQLNDAGPAAARRIFSALQREIHNSDQDAARDGGESESESKSDQSMSRPFQDTLRRAPSGRIKRDSLSISSLQSHSNSVSKSVPFASSSNTNIDEIYLLSDQGTAWLSGHECKYSEPTKRLTPQQIAHFNEPEAPSPKKPLREVKYAFFPSESRIEPPTTSPYRRAMNDSRKGPFNVLLSDVPVGPDAWRVQDMASAQNCSTTRSESIYSRTEGGNTPRVAGSPSFLPRTESSGEPGMAFIIPNRNYSPGIDMPRHTSWQKTSDHSSGEWKSWMASELSQFENHFDQHGDIYNAFPVNKSRHKRENAQWNGDEAIAGRVFNPVDLAKQPLGLVQTEANVRPALQESMVRSNIVRSSLQDVEASGKEATVPQKENTPNTCAQISFNKPLNIVDDKVVSNSFTTSFTGSAAKSATINSQTTPNASREINSSPANRNDRISPKRVERLSRILSKSSQSLKRAEISSSTNSRHGRVSSGQALDRQKVIGEFLKKRRSHMGVSDKSGGDLAFL